MTDHQHRLTAAREAVVEAVSERDIVERLQEGRVSQTCRHCDLGKPGSDSVVYVRCGRGDCLAEHEDRHEAAAEILRLRAALAVMPVTVPASYGFDAGYQAGWLAGRDAAAEVCAKTYRPAHTRSSENADIYRVQDDTIAAAVKNIKALEPPS